MVLLAFTGEGVIEARRRVRLIERTAREVRLPREDFDFLLLHARSVLEATPTLNRGVYRIIPHSFAGWFHTPNCRISIRPRCPWPTLCLLLAGSRKWARGEDDATPGRALIEIVAAEFAERLKDVIAKGVVHGYDERDRSSTFLRGRLRTVDQIRSAAALAFPNHFEISDAELAVEAPWNRIPRTIGAKLLEHPELPPATRDKLEDLLPAFGVAAANLTDQDFLQADADPRAAHYRELLALCRQLREGFSTADVSRPGAGAFLFDLSRAFEDYLADQLRNRLSSRPGWRIERHREYRVGSTVLEPDVTILNAGAPVAVLDAKWKRLESTSEAADLHQIIAYATVTGAQHVALVYPGGRFTRRTIEVPRTSLRISLLRVCVTGRPGECEKSIGRLIGAMRRNQRGTSAPTVQNPNLAT